MIIRHNARLIFRNFWRPKILRPKNRYVRPPVSPAAHSNAKALPPLRKTRTKLRQRSRSAATMHRCGNLAELAVWNGCSG